jgi:hypothetical protein
VSLRDLLFDRRFFDALCDVKPTRSR